MKKQEKKRENIILQVILNHIKNNQKYYLTISIVFLIGLIIGVTYINQINTEAKEQTSQYITKFIDSIKVDHQIDKAQLLRSSIIEHIILAIIIWIMGFTIIGIPIVYIIIGIRGFSLGYTISTIIISLGIWKGMLFTFISIFLQNLIIIPSIFAISVSGIKLYKFIMKDRRKENIKVEMLRHTIFSLIMGGFLLLASFVEVYMSSNLVSMCIQFL